MRGKGSYFSLASLWCWEFTISKVTLEFLIQNIHFYGIHHVHSGNFIDNARIQFQSTVAELG